MKKRISCFVLVLALFGALVAPAQAAANANVQTTAIAAGMSHSLALADDGTVYAWGDNSSGQLGFEEDIAKQERPAQIPGLTSVTSVAAGYNYSLALRYNGRVYEWGAGRFGEPREISGLDNVVAIAAGQRSSLALTVDGRVFQWDVGHRPNAVSRLKNIVAISAGSGHYMALTRSGEVYTWGFGENGQLGDGTTTVERTTPKKVSGLIDIVSIAAGATHSLAADFTGKVYAWGSNDKGQLGIKDCEDNVVLVPTCVDNLEKIVQVAAGHSFSLARTSNGRVYSWGYGEYGQLCGGTSEISRKTPRVITNISSTDTVSYMTCGLNHAMCITSNGDVYVWGRNNFGQIGNARNENANTAARAKNGISADGAYDSCIFRGASDWALDEIVELYPMCITPPTLMDNYQLPVTRAEFAHLLVTVYESTNEEATPPKRYSFVDIDEHTLKNSILKAFRLGIVNGTSDTTFEPESNITRQEAATMLCRFVAIMQKTTIPRTPKNLSYYKDAADIEEWAAPYVDYAYNNKIMIGSDGKFEPFESFTHEQSLLTIVRLAKSNNWKAR